MGVREWGVDAAVCAGAVLFGFAQLMLAASSIVIPDLALRQYLGIVNLVPDVRVFVGLALTIVPIVVRRVFPIPVFLFCLITFIGMQNAFDGFSLSVIGPVIALYTVASELGIPETVACACVAVAALLFGDVPAQTASLAFFTRLQNVTFVVAAALAGYAYRTHRAYVVAVEERAAEAERTREEEASRRVEEERVRIAREVHDITAHSLSAVSIQAAAAERLIDRDPAAAKEAVSAARATAKSALDDIRSMIGVLRHGDDAVEKAPAGGTDQLDDLASYLREAGVSVEVRTQGYDRAAVPAHVDMALYTLAREAVTNIVRHAGASRATIEASMGGGCVRLTVADDGRGCGTPAQAAGTLPVSSDGEGHGIMGMAERVRVLGGEFSAGDAPGGGFVVRAVIPVAGVEG